MHLTQHPGHSLRKPFKGWGWLTAMGKPRWYHTITDIKALFSVWMFLAYLIIEERRIIEITLETYQIVIVWTMCNLGCIIIQDRVTTLNWIEKGNPRLVRWKWWRRMLIGRPTTLGRSLWVLYKFGAIWAWAIPKLSIFFEKTALYPTLNTVAT